MGKGKDDFIAATGGFPFLQPREQRIANIQAAIDDGRLTGGNADAARRAIERIRSERATPEDLME